MLNKKPIAVLAAGATLASGLAFAAPALAVTGGVRPPINTPSQTNVQELKGVVFNFKVGDVEYKSTAMDLHTNGTKYGATKDELQYTLQQLVDSCCEDAQSKIKPIADGVDAGTLKVTTYPTKITGGEQPVTASIEYTTDLQDSAVEALANAGFTFDKVQEALKNAEKSGGDKGKKISPAQYDLFKKSFATKRAAQQKPYEEAAKAAKLINDGSIEAKDADKKATKDFLEATKAFAGKNFDELTDDEAMKAGSEAVKLNDKLSAALKAKLPELEKAIAEAKNSLGFGYPLSAIIRNDAETPADGTMYRLYNTWTGEHLFTINPQEKDNDVAAGWTFEGTVGKALLEKGDPVYRLLNPNTGEHHYTMAQDEVKNCVAAGWKDEGVVFYSAKKDDKGAIAMVSLYNPYREAFYHHYTSDEGEIQARVADGWKNEGPKFYLVK